MTVDRRVFLAALGAAGAGALAQRVAFAQPAGKPIVIGSTLALTGPLAATAMVHKLTGEIYVEDLNKRGGLLGRPVQWLLKDDQSKPDIARTLYEQLITSDKVDLLLGPYATGNILSAMGVAQRHEKMLVHHTFGIPKLAKYDRQFSSWSFGPTPEISTPNLVLDAMASTPHMPKTVAIVT
ncbi:MAG: ABC transporter substrate-binding protein, partial [Pusillimonas sp.]